jgi:hypothetical protein
LRSKLPVGPVRLSELQLKIQILRGCAGTSAAPTAIRRGLVRYGMFCKYHLVIIYDGLGSMNIIGFMGASETRRIFHTLTT